MKRSVAVFLAVAAVAVAIENVVYLRQSSPPLPDASQTDAEPPAEASGVAAPGSIDAVCADALDAFLAALPDLERARSAFLTRAEAVALAAAGTPVDPAGPQGLVLEGTLVNPARRIAWLDGVTASEGGWVGDHEVVRIEPRSVLLRKGSAELRIELRTPVEEASAP